MGMVLYLQEMDVLKSSSKALLGGYDPNMCYVFGKSLMDFSLQAKSEDQLSHEKAWLEAENVWLVHR